MMHAKICLTSAVSSQPHGGQALANENGDALRNQFRIRSPRTKGAENNLMADFQPFRHVLVNAT